MAGFWTAADEPRELEAVLAGMTGCLAHRGPDSDGAWIDARHGIALGHRRLAIVDLSETGAQPMSSASGRWTVVLNGEIYNYRTLRDELRRLGHSFRGTSDTEVLLAAVEAWGVEQAMQRSAGMFALALWDARDHLLYLVRDRLGEKPLYVATLGRSVVFASELKALRRHPEWVGRVSHQALHDLLRFGYVPTRSCIYEGVRKVVPGTIQVYALRGAGPAHEREIVYWSAQHAAARSAAERFSDPPEMLVDRLDAVLGTVVSEEMVADVPLGAFLSGGIDSSLIVALMQRQGGSAVRTFAIGFDVPAYDESPYAKAVAEHLGTSHTELRVTAREAMDVVPRLPAIYDEPFADSSQIPTFLVSQLARRSVTVSLSGDGGDEVFGGYTRYEVTDRVWRTMSAYPLALRRAAAWPLRAFSAGFWDGVGGAVGRIAPSLRMRSYGDKARRLARMLVLPSREALYEEILSSWPDAAAPLTSRGNGHASRAAIEWPEHDLAFVERMMFADLVGYLRDDVLVKVDRAAMAVSLETRAPYLDHRVVELAARLPYDVKLREGTPKWILRQLLLRFVPQRLIERPKRGFAVPVHAWLRGGMREWVEALLDPARLRREGYFAADAIADVWRLHLTGTNALAQLWPVLMFQAWLEAQEAPTAALSP